MGYLDPNLAAAVPAQCASWPRSPRYTR